MISLATGSTGVSGFKLDPADKSVACFKSLHNVNWDGQSSYGPWELKGPTDSDNGFPKHRGICRATSWVPIGKALLNVSEVPEGEASQDSANGERSATWESFVFARIVHLPSSEQASSAGGA